MSKYYLLTKSSGSSLVLGSFYSSGNPRIFEGTSLYVYRLGGELLKTDDIGSTWTNVRPQDIGVVTAMCQVLYGTDTYSYALGTGTGLSYIAQYQKAPETTAWSTGSPPPAAFQPVDVISDIDGLIPIIAGSGFTGGTSKTRIISNYPSFTFGTSGSGFPATAAITDLDLTQ